MRFPIDFPDTIYLVGFRGKELGNLISIIEEERIRLEVRRKNADNVQLAVDLTEDIAEIQATLDKLEHIKEGCGPSILDEVVP